MSQSNSAKLSRIPIDAVLQMLCFTASRPTKTTDGDALKTTQVCG